MATYGQFLQFQSYWSAGVEQTSLRVYHYIAGTTSLQNVWTDRAKTSTAAQPVQSDANGVVSFYADGLYKFRIDGSTDGVNYTTLYTYDNVSVADAAALLGKGADLASASTVTFGTDGSYFHITGTTTITAFSGNQSTVILKFDASLTLTNSGNLILRSGANFVTQAGDVLSFVNESGGVWREVSRNLAVATQIPAIVQEFRLSLTTAVPVTTADVTAAGTLYCVPYVGNRITLYDGATWVTVTSAEFSLALTATSGKPYDVWCYLSSGVPTLETLVWTNDTTQATPLARQNGVLVKSGDATRRYLGSFYTSGANVTEDSAAKRYLWNYYNRIPRTMLVVDTANSWTYTVAAFQQARASATNQLDFMIGVAEDVVQATVYSISANSTGSGVFTTNGIGLDSATVDSSSLRVNPSINYGASTAQANIAVYQASVAAGRHTLKWLEYSVATGTTTWYGDDNSVLFQSGIWGIVRG